MNTNKKTTATMEIGGKTLTLETGSLAKQATSSVLARLGDTMVLVTVVMGRERTDIDYFPLTVEYVERLYAGGRIKGSRWVKREGRPTDDAILTARLIDRSVRPLFPKELKKEVQIIATVLSVDGENSPDILSVVATSAALAISPIPWKGPVGAVRIGHVTDKETKKSEFIVNPGVAESELSELDLIVTSLKGKTLMLEAGALQIAESTALEGIKKAQAENDKIISFIEDFAKKIGAKKEEVKPNTEFQELVALLEKSYKAEIVELVKNRVNKESSGDSGAFIDQIIEQEKAKDEEFKADKKLMAKAIEYIMFKSIRANTLEKGVRPDGRKIDEIRPISCEVSVLPRTHGSAIFNRGDTQALTIVTLGSPRLEQLIESAEGEESKRYIHHYNMPPYSVGEAGRFGFTSRREIGHGALGERAIMGVIPNQAEFPYTIRVVSEILSSNGSTSMAATCGSTLALMDAGVPIKKPVAGIAMGMVSKDDKYVILTDILGLEDFSGDMDFKVAGTDSGVTAIQLDVKILGLTISQIEEVFERAKKARLFILEKMIAVVGTGKKAVSEYAPKIEQVQIPTDRIGEVIGPGGRVIKNIIATTGATVDVEDSGVVTISGTDAEAVVKAVDWVKGIVREVKVGEIFENGIVKRILPFGAFVEFLPGKEGMVHVSKMAEGFVRNPLDVVQIGQEVKVKVIEIDDQGRTNLSMLFGENKAGENVPPKREDPADDDQSQIPAAPAVATPSEHPLARQFRRERFSKGPNRAQGNWRDRRSSGGTGTSGQANPRFRKSHY
ncbi:MAG: polyribonucleotide nucleotidyltransferase [Candidatus Levybacteria bacterium]|nr:polyribonucleotide nucleotidyltransferase [Candidatus Levybacteria bacterium]MDZ4228292.1 polyribonucleotide nucleotidyltransferase [Candidatus Levybacteria bacterium]